MTQDEALDILKFGHNVFLTGAAGAGKSFLLNQYIRFLRRHTVSVAITASTGIAATHLGGRTIHSWSGMGVKDELKPADLNKIKKNKRLKKSIRRTKVLVIDEISMLAPTQLDMVDEITRTLRDNALPFGGLQVILCGDFFQLPPVVKAESNSPPGFAFAARVWQEGEFKVCYLHEQHRQQDDVLLTILNDIRSGRAGEHTKTPLRTRYRREPRGATKATVLYTHNVNVNHLNQKHLAKLPGPERYFAMATRGMAALVEGLKKNCPVPERLTLKKDAEVMFVKNAADGTYVNGTRGTVVGFNNEEGWPCVRTYDGNTLTVTPAEWTLEDDGVIRAELTQIPLRLAWAITVHKSQGMSLDAVEIDLSDAFEAGMGYVGLSRARRFDGLKLMGLNDIALQVNATVLARDGEFKRQSAAARADITKFSVTEKRRRQQDVLRERFDGKTPAPESKRANLDGNNNSVVNNNNSGDRGRGKIIALSKPPALSETLSATLALVQQQLPLAEIASQRSLKEETILNHLEKLKGLKQLPDIAYLQTPLADKDFAKAIQAFRDAGHGHLKPIHEQFVGRFSFLELRLARLFSW